MDRSNVATVESSPPVEQTVMTVLLALSFSHMLNDMIQSTLPAIYPLLKSKFVLTFAQVGMITTVFQCTASLLQPIIGFATDRRPQPYSLALGMGVTLVGLVCLARAGSYPMILLAAGLVGLGSSVFHPEASRMARLASGGKHGFAQSLFQVGGNFGTSLGPLLAAAIVMPYGQGHVLWFSALAFIGMILLTRVGNWYRDHLNERQKTAHKHAARRAPLPRSTVIQAMAVLVALIFSKYIYLSSLTNYYTFYLVARFGVSAQHAQILLFLFLFAVAAGTIVGGPVGDRIGRKYVIWISILGVAPFTWLLPQANLFWTAILSVIIGAVLASAFSAILVYAQELVPGKVGLIAGIFFGLAFGIAGIASARLGKLADRIGIIEVFSICRYLPLLGLLTAFLPNLDRKRA
ncbi:MFS transporter [Opitutaceae bacterium EW11]|nr:MFS transporter [Opitutaceae bacterium EW11]